MYEYSARKIIKRKDIENKCLHLGDFRYRDCKFK